MPATRTYADLGDACATAHALDVIGDRWSLIIVRELVLGPRRFADLQSAVIGITPGVLSGRLRGLQAAGVLEQVTLPDLARTRAYRLTSWGAGLEDVMRALGRWAQGSPAFPLPDNGMTPDGVIVAMRTMLPRGADLPRPDRPLALALELTDVRRPAAGSRRYRLLWSEDGVELVEGTVEHADATVVGDSTAWTGVVFGGLPIRKAERQGALSVEGDRAVIERVVGLFSPVGSGFEAR